MTDSGTNRQVRSRSGRRCRRTPVGWAVVLPLVLLAAAVVVVPRLVEPAAAVAATKPNVVLVLTDDMRYDDLRYLPNIRKLLVEKGRSYTQAIAPHPLCCPTRAELVTGQYGQNSGVQHNAGRWGGFHALRDKSNTLGLWLSRAGYRTQYTGKYLNEYDWDHGATRAQTPRPPGWTIWDPAMTDVYSYWKTGFYNGDRPRGYVADVLTRRTNAAIQRFHREQKPFFLFVNQLAPHNAGSAPWNPRYKSTYADYLAGTPFPIRKNPAFNEADVSDLPRSIRGARVGREESLKRAALWRDRLRALRSVDDSVARIVGELRRTGELAQTYFVFTSDNGFQLGEHRIVGKNRLFEESLRVPLIVRGPGIAPGSVERRQVSLVDLTPTILGWAGAKAGRRADGLALQQLGGSQPFRDTILVQTGDAADDRSPGWWFRGVRTPRYTYARIAGDLRQGVLFDRRRDPHELVNVFHDPAYASVRAELARRTTALEGCAGSTCNRVFGPVPAPA